MEMCYLCNHRKIHAGGTVKVNRKGLPQDGVFPKKGNGKRVKGDVKCMKKDGEEIYFTAWQDNKPVHMLSTFKPYLRKILRKSAALGWKKGEIDSHTLIPAYNHGMGGTDLMDQYNSYYSFDKKGVRWTHRVITHFLGVTVINARILFNLCNPTIKLTNFEYIDEVVKSLADLDKSFNWNLIEDEPEYWPDPNPRPVVARKGRDASALPPSTSPESPEPKGKFHHRNRRANLEVAVERTEGIHVPSLLPSKNRRRCVFHNNVKQRYFCETCDVALCMDEVGKESCWYKFHHCGKWGDV
jgi:hypothetical protein